MMTDGDDVVAGHFRHREQHASPHKGDFAVRRETDEPRKDVAMITL